MKILPDVVPDWKKIPTHISTVCMALYSAAILAFNMLPSQMQESFNQQELRWASFILMVIGIAGKYVDQYSKVSDHD